ncbi:hypothetical protein [Novosphingobium sp. ST904]|uniref:hypothetical protein n=1 Tax=Novosphingobium sp. ST904 TaxID=1684385 RepID=UPI000A4650D5|nr:hypothetical protein [Novosphingobium sp. ST904]TCM39391.1 hypothetical protein EDF59_106278 [Novosphingobium sp. ST904]
MLHDVLADLAGGAVEGAADLASDEIRRRSGWKGCLTVALVALGVVLVLLWWLGAFRAG